MSEENSTEGSDEGVKDLRKKYEALLKENKQKDEELVGFRKSARTSSVAELLKAKGVDAKYARLYTDDEVSEDSVAAFLKANEDIIPAAAAVVDANAENARAVSDASGSTEGSITNTGDGVLGDPEEIGRLIATLPYAELVKLGLMPKSNFG